MMELDSPGGGFTKNNNNRSKVCDKNFNESEFCHHQDKGFLLDVVTFANSLKYPQEVDGDDVVSHFGKGYDYQIKKGWEWRPETVKEGEEDEEEDEEVLDLDFETRRKVGGGAFGEVYALDSKCGVKKYAEKQIKLTEQNIKDMRNEVAIHKNLHHENIIEFLSWYPEHFAPNETLYIYLNYVPDTLTSFLAKEEFRRDELYVLYLLKQLFEAVKYLHSKQIVHCDIKSANILVNEEEVLLQLCDFGLAHDLRNGMIMKVRGTPNFMAPEACNVPKEGFGKSVDIWSIGCTCYEMLTGFPLFKEHDGDAILFMVGSLKWKPEAPENCSDICEDFLDSCWEQNPFKRITIENLIQHPFVTRVEKASEDSYSDFEHLTSFEEDDEEENSLDLDEEIDYPNESFALPNNVALTQMNHIPEDISSTVLIQQQRYIEEEDITNTTAEFQKDTYMNIPSFLQNMTLEE